MKKTLLVLLSCLLVVSMLGSACGFAEEEQTVLRIAWWGNQLRNDTTISALKLYEELNPGIKFETEFTDWGSYWDKMAVLAASGSLPDLMQHDYGYLLLYQSKGQLQELTPYVESGILNIDNVPNSVLSGMTVDGNLYAIAMGNQALAIAYDKDITDAAEVDIPEQFASLEEYMDACRTIYERTGAKTRVHDTFNTVRMLAFSKGEKLFVDDYSEVGFSYETLLDYFMFLQTGLDEGWLLTQDIYAERTALEQETIIDKITWNCCLWSTQINALTSAANRHFELMMFPMAEGGSQNTFLMPSMPFVITANSEHKEEAAKVIDFLINSVDCNKLLLAERGVPSSTAVIEALTNDPEFELTPAALQNFEFVARAGELSPGFGASSILYPSGVSEATTLSQDITSLLMYGEITPEDAATQLIDGVNEILARVAEG